MILSLKPGSKLYLNGAVIRVDRKVNIELVNDAVFILDTHIMLPEKATTPLKQLYFVIQSVLMDPDNAELTQKVLGEIFDGLKASFENPTVLQQLQIVEQQLAEDRAFDAMKTVRKLFPLEEEILYCTGDAQLSAA